jgi:hypothetical protein
MSLTTPKLFSDVAGSVTRNGNGYGYGYAYGVSSLAPISCQ